MKDNLEDMIAVINGAVDCVIPDAECVVLFGSWARGDVRPFSDIDLAISLPVNPDLLVLGDLAGRVEAASGRQVDVVLLRDLPERDPELAFKIADEGVLVTQRLPGAYSTFKKRAFLQYLDTEHLRRIVHTTLHKRILDGHMGRRNYV